MPTDNEPDYKLAARELEASTTAILTRIRAATWWLRTRKDQTGASGWKHDMHTLVVARGAVKAHFAYRTGLSLRGEPAPTSAEVLGAVAWAATGAAPPFEAWAADLGYNTDSRKAEAIHRQCRAGRAKLHRLGFTIADITALAEITRRL